VNTDQKVSPKPDEEEAATDDKKNNSGENL